MIKFNCVDTFVELKESLFPKSQLLKFVDSLGECSKKEFDLDFCTKQDMLDFVDGSHNMKIADFLQIPVDDIIISFVGDAFAGEIVTSNHKIRWEFEREYQYGEYTEATIRKEFVENDKLYPIDQISLEDGIWVEIDMTYSAILKLSNTHSIEFENTHNGYYCHELEVYIDDKLKWQVSL